jgi:TonB-linked SusC/RagA family outer membrane protein
MSALATSPVYPAYDSLGNYGVDNRNKAIANPVMLAREQNIEYFTNRVLGNLSFNWDIIKGLSFNTVLGGDLRNTKENFFWGPFYYEDKTQMAGSGRTSDNNFNGLSLVWTNTLNYDLDLKEHHFTLLLGHEASMISSEGTYAEVGGMPLSGIQTFGSSPAKLVSRNYVSESSLESYFGRLNYSFRDRYLAQVNVRRDGSSRFGPDTRWGVFPAASFGWNIAKEAFMEPVSFISELKPRFSIGKTGNQEVGDYDWRGSFSVGTIPNSYDVDNEVMNYLDLLGGRYTSISDYGYSWEEHTTANLGIDMSFFKNRIYLSADVYKRVSDGLLLWVDLPATTGIGGAWNNAGKVTNRGFEFTLTTHNIDGTFKWTTDLNFATNNFVVNNLVTDSIQGFQTILIEGQSLGFYSYVREEYVDSATGYVKLVDLNRDGKISYGGGPQDRTITGSPLPKWYGGITNNFSWMGIDLSIFTQFVYGNEIYNATRQALEDLQVAAGLTVGLNCTQEAFDKRWLDADVLDKDGNVLWKRNVHTKYPTTNYAGANIDQREGNNGFIEDGSYLRIKSVTLGYTLPARIIEKAKIHSARIYFTGNNLYTFTKYSGFDPEVSSITGEGISANLSQGIDGGAYPQSRTLLFGISVSF